MSYDILYNDMIYYNLVGGVPCVVAVTHRRATVPTVSNRQSGIRRSSMLRYSLLRYSLLILAKAYHAKLLLTEMLLKIMKTLH